MNSIEVCGPSEAHRAFVRAVVALAREHNMTSLQLTFQSAPARMGEPQQPWGQITAQWSQGRHGDKAEITLRFQSQEQLKEESP